MKTLTALAACLLLAACATGYQTTGFSGGLSETQLSPNVWQVRFNGNAYTSGERASDFVLLRAAELMMESGYEYFAVVDSASEARAYTYTTPQTSTTTVNANTSVFGNTATTTGTATTNTYGGQAYTRYKPSSSLVAVGTNDPVDEGNLVFSSQFLIDTLTEKHGVELIED